MTGPQQSPSPVGQTIPIMVPAKALRIAGITPFTSIDFPGRLSAVVFVQGCPCRCTYCQNPWMQPREIDPQFEAGDWSQVERLLQKRRGLLDGIVFSGGEPTIDPALPAAIAEVKAAGFQVGLHTSGVYPEKVARLLGQLDWVGLDVKAPPLEEDLFERITGMKRGAELFRRTFSVLKESGIEVEYRTTAHPDYLDEAALERLAQWLASNGVERWVLQIYRRPQGLLTSLYRSVPDSWPSAAFIERQKKRFKAFLLRRAT